MDKKTTYNLREAGKAWWIPANRADRDEYLYNAAPVTILDTVLTPFTIESKSCLSLRFLEANLFDFACMTFVNNTGTQLKTDLVPCSDGAKIWVKNSYTSSWRTLQIGEKLTDLITSYLILNLNETDRLKFRQLF